MLNWELYFDGMQCRKINEAMLILCRIAIAEAGKPYRKDTPRQLPIWNNCVSVFLHSRSSPLHADWRKSDSSVDGEPQGNWRWNSNSRDVVASSPSFSRPAARAPRRACSQANGGTAVIHQESIYKKSEVWGKGVLV